METQIPTRPRPFRHDHIPLRQSAELLLPSATTYVTVAALWILLQAFMQAAKLRAARKEEEVLYTVRVGKIPPKVSDKEIIDVFSAYGEIGGFSRPIVLDKRIPSQFAFIKYKDQAAAREAVVSMDCAYIWDSDISVSDANSQESFFSKNTGGLINHEYPFPPKVEEEFDSSMPYNHYQMKRQEALKHTDQQLFTVKVVDIHPEITKEMLMEIYTNFGDVASIYQPVDLQHNCRPLGLAFIRYTTRSAAEQAVKETNGANLGIGRDLIVSLSENRSYFSQNESYYNPKKWTSTHKQAMAFDL